MNTVAIRNTGGTAVAALQSLKTGLANVQQSLPPSMGDMLLRMLKDGGWVYGPENIEVEDGSLWAINPMSIAHGFVCWTNYDPKERKKNELLGERMVSMTAPKPTPESLPSYDNGRGGAWEWNDQVAFDLVCVSGEDKGEQVHYKTTSVGGIRAVHELIDKIMKQLDVDANTPVPVVELSSDSYEHRSYGKTYVPIFVVKQWAGLDDAELDDSNDDAGDEPQQAQPATPEPARRRRSGGEQASTQQAEQQAPQANPQPAQADPSEAGAPGAPRRRRRNA